MVMSELELAAEGEVVIFAVSGSFGYAHEV